MIKKKWFMQIKYEFLVITLSFCFPYGMDKPFFFLPMSVTLITHIYKGGEIRGFVGNFTYYLSTSFVL